MCGNDPMKSVLPRQGVFLDTNGNVAEGPNMNVAIITQDGTFVVRTRCNEAGCPVGPQFAQSCPAVHRCLV